MATVQVRNLLHETSIGIHGYLPLIFQQIIKLIIVLLSDEIILLYHNVLTSSIFIYLFYLFTLDIYSAEFLPIQFCLSLLTDLVVILLCGTLRGLCTST